MRKNRKVVSVFGICLLFLLLGINGNLQAQTSQKTCVGKEIVLTGGGGSDDCRNFVWTTDGGQIVYGKGTNSVALTFFTAGTKNVMLGYLKSGSQKYETFALTVYAKPMFGAVSLDAICSTGEFNPKTLTVRGEYTPESGQWWLDGSPINKGDILNRSDNGKLLQYSVETPCGREYSDGIAIKVNDKPTILSINGLPAKTSVGGNLHASINVNENGSSAQYAWILGGDTIARGVKEIDYKTKLDDNGKIMSIEVLNGCGSQSVSHVMTSSVVTTGPNSGLLSTIPIPEAFQVQDFNADTHKHSLPDKYWENKNYKFYTSNTYYSEGSSVWFDYDKTKNGWIPSSIGRGYEFKTYRAPANLLNLPRENNTTILLDCIDTYTVDVSSNPDTPFQLFQNTSGFAYKCKIFGLKNVINGNVDDRKRVTIKFNSPDVSSDLPTGMRIQSVTDCVLENIKFDGNNRTFYNYFINVIDGEDGNQNNDYLILKDISVFNVKNKVQEYRPRSVVVFIGQNRRVNTNQTHIRNQRYVYNLVLDASCQGVPGKGTGINAAVYVYGSENIYFDRIMVGTLPGNGFDDALIIGRGYDYTLKDSRNIIIKEFISQFGKIRLSHTYEHRNIVIPADKYRYFRFEPTNVYSVEAFIDEPAYKKSAIVYDRQTGYYIVPASMATSNLTALSSLYKDYLNTETGPGSTEGCPSPNILLIADPNTSQINGFTVPDLGIKAQVNIVAMGSGDYNLGAKQDVKWSYSPETPIVFDATSSLQKVSLYNIDFTGSDYFIDNLWKNAQPGTFYNCSIKTHVESTNDDDLLKIETGTALDEFDNTGVNIFAGSGNIEIQSTEGLIRQIDCYDLQGRLLVTKANVDNSVYSVAVPSGNQVLIVKVKTDKQVKIKKLLINK